jgi:hypothetical protein
MFERLEARARTRAAARARALAERVAAEAGAAGAVRAAVDEEGVRLSGRGLRRRMAIEPWLRALPWRIG